MQSLKLREKRRVKIKKTIRGSAALPRLVVFRSNKYLYGQLIDDVAGKTLASVSKIKSSQEAGTKIAQDAIKLKISKVVFDRAGYKYHGKVEKFADAARAAGLKF